MSTLILFLFMVLGLAYYGITTRDEAIRRRAIEFLAEATSGQVDVGHARFRMFGGTTLRDVRISVPFEPKLDPIAQSAASREIFSARSLKLVHSPWRLLFGGLDVQRIIAVQPKITIVRNVDTGMQNWQLLKGAMGTSRAGRARPMITVRQASVVFVAVDSDGRRDDRHEELDADVRPYPQSSTGYCIEVRRFSRPAERTTAVFDPSARLLTNTPFVDVRTVRQQLPRAAREFFDRISLEGEVKLDRMIYDTEVPVDRDTEIQLRRVRCRIPLAMLRSGTEPGAADAVSRHADEAEAAVEMSRVSGEIDLRGDRLNLNISGVINDAKCKVSGQITGTEEAPEGMGIDLSIDVRGIPAPEGEFRRQLIEGPLAPEMVRRTIQDYDPRGRFDIVLQVSRPPGPHQEAKVTGYFSPLKASGAAASFPYRVDNLVGSVRLETSRMLVDLQGTHDSAEVVVGAVIDQGLEWAKVTVRIDGRAIPFDQTLFELLPEGYRRLWERFDPKGTSNVVVHVTRPESDEFDEPDWSTRVEASLQKASLLFSAFPYALSDCEGRILVSKDRIDVEELVGRHGDGVVRCDGFANLDERGELHIPTSGGPAASFRIEGRSLRMDESLAAALPAEGRETFEQFELRGAVDVDGTLTIPDEATGLVHDLVARLHDVRVRYREFPLPIEAITGEIRLRPEGIVISDVVGRHRDATIRAHGQVNRLEDGHTADLKIEAHELVLDAALKETLPPQLQRVWELLEPTGRVSVRSSLHQSTRNGQVRRQHRTEIELAEASLRFRGLPVRLTGVAARAVVTDQRVEIISLRGLAGESRVELSGIIDLGDAGYRGSLNVRTEELMLDEDLLKALPSAVAEMARSMNAQGRVAVDFAPMMFDVDAAGHGRWDVSGNLSLRGASMNLGFEAEKVTGKLTGRLVADGEGKAAVDMDVALSEATLADWPLQDVQGKILSDPATGRIRVDDVIATAYEGEAAGSAEIDIRKTYVAWQASLVARDLKLASFLESMGGSKDATTVGTIEGNMILQGRSGRNSYREGAGEIFVRDAQVWRLPLVFAIFQVLNLTPDENVFHDGWIKYYLSRDTLTFQKIDLQGKAVAFIGGGRMDMNTRQIDVTLVAGSPVRLKLPLITEFLEGASRELMQVRLTGTFNEPNIQPLPLKSLTKALQTIFPEPPKRGSGSSRGSGAGGTRRR